MTQCVWCCALVGVVLGCGTSAEVNGIFPPRTMQPVMGGHVASPAEQHGTVAILEDDALSCTGTLLAPSLVLTAAHCVISGGTDLPPSSLKVVSDVLAVAGATSANIHTVRSVTRHEAYPGMVDPADLQGLGALNDIALLMLDVPVTGQPSVAILPMTNLDAHVPANTALEISGYGDDGLGHVGVLLTGTTPYTRRNATEFAAGGLGEADTCPGDSGGPVYVTVGGQLTLLGCTSRAFANPTRACGEGGIYTLVPAYQGWIAQHASGLLPLPGGSSSSGGVSGASSSLGTSSTSLAATSHGLPFGNDSTSAGPYKSTPTDPVGRVRAALGFCACASGTSQGVPALGLWVVLAACWRRRAWPSTR